MKRKLALVLCAVLLIGCGCAYGAVEQAAQGTEYDLYFLAEDYQSAAGGGALSVEKLRVKDKPQDVQAWQNFWCRSCWMALKGRG